MSRLLIVEADGGSRGNPGPAAYGALVRDGETGRILAEVAETIGEATNNVAEYRGMVAGLQCAQGIDPGARVEARLDSKLIVEQMSGRWAIRNAALRELALAARRIPLEVTYTWVPRSGLPDADDVVGEAREQRAEEVRQEHRPHRLVGWAQDLGTPTTMLLGRHGATEYSLDKRFSGAGGFDAPLAAVGLRQAEALGREIAARGGVDAIVASPLLRTLQTAERVAHHTGASIDVDAGIIECGFGEWDGHTFAEVSATWPIELAAWLSSTDVAPPGGESFAECRDRVDRARRGILQRHGGQRQVMAAVVAVEDVDAGAAVGGKGIAVAVVDFLAEQVEVATELEYAGHARGKDHVINGLFAVAAGNDAIAARDEVVVGADVGEQSGVEARARCRGPA